MSQGQYIIIDKSILEYEMDNANVFKTEEKLPLTKIAEKLVKANSTAFTVCFTTKVDEKVVHEKLSNVKDLKDDAAVSALAKELLVGKETTISCHHANVDGKMGRSLVIDLSTGGFK